MAQLGFNRLCHINLLASFLYQSIPFLKKDGKEKKKKERDLGQTSQRDHKGTKSCAGGISPVDIIPLNRAEFRVGQKKTADLEIMVHAGKTPLLFLAP